MLTQNPENLVESIRSQLGNICAHWSTCHQRRHPTLSHRRLGHIARLQDSTPLHKALQSHVNLSLGRLPHPSWSRRPGRLRGRWIDQIRNDTSQTPADLWRQALGRGHHGRERDGPSWLCDDDDDDDSLFYCTTVTPEARQNHVFGEQKPLNRSLQNFACRVPSRT